MVQDIIGVLVIVLVYVCVFIVVFSPTLYAFWIYLVSRKVKMKRKGLLGTALTTLCINLVLAYFAFHLAVDYFLVAKVAEKDALAAKALRTALVSQQKYYDLHGRYYSVGPVRGPYKDDHGLSVDEDVILLVEPHWDRKRKAETFRAYALHVWGRDLVTTTQDGRVTPLSKDSSKSGSIRSKLINSTK